MSPAATRLTVVEAAAVMTAEVRLPKGVHPSPSLPCKGRISPAAAYALAACQRLSAVPAPCALVCVAGLNGVGISHFDKAHQASGGPGLVGPRFARAGYRRIHPLTLLVSLQNQVAAVLSIELGLTGPCLNLWADTCNPADLWPNLLAYSRSRPVLLVFASAGNREEERSLSLAADPHFNGVEGAAAFLLRDQGHGMGYLRCSPVSAAGGSPRLECFSGWDATLHVPLRIFSSSSGTQGPVPLAGNDRQTLFWEPEL